MRGAAAVLALILAACSTAGGDTTTTTTPLAEPSSTSTTTAPSTTTTNEEVCVERDGLLRTNRGFVCPPYLVGWDGTQFNPNPPIHQPGSYETRAFAVPFSFVAPVPLPSNGDSNSLVQLFQGPNDELAASYPPRSSMRVWAGDAASWVGAIPETEWEWGELVQLEESDFVVDGYSGARHDFTCTGPEDAECVAGDLEGITIGYRHGQRVTILDIGTPNGRVVFEVFADPGRLSEFWKEVAEPILDSIDFLDL